MKKQFLALLMLGAFVGQAWGAESNNTIVQVTLSKNDKGKIAGGGIDLYFMRNGERVSEKGFPKAISDGQAGIAGRWKPLTDSNPFPSVEDRLEIIKGWFPGDKELQKVNKLEIVEKQKEEEEERVRRVKEAAAEQERLRQEEATAKAKAEKKKQADEQLEIQKAKKAEKARIAAAELAEQQRKAQEEADRIERERVAEEQRIARIAAEELRMEQERLVAEQLQAELLAEVVAEQIRLAAVEEVELKMEADRLAKLRRIEEERIERERIAALERAEAIERERLAELARVQELESQRLAEIQRLRVAEEMALIKRMQEQQSRAEQEEANARRILAVAEASKNRFKGLYMTCANCAHARDRSQCGAFEQDPFCRIALRYDFGTPGKQHEQKYPLDFEDTFYIWKSGFVDVSANATDAEFSPLFRLLYDCARGFYEDPHLQEWNEVKKRKLAYYVAAGIDAPELKSWAQKFPSLMSELKKHGFTLEDLQRTSPRTLGYGYNSYYDPALVVQYFKNHGTAYEKAIFKYQDSKMYDYLGKLTKFALQGTQAGRDALALVAAQEAQEKAQQDVAQLQAAAASMPTSSTQDLADEQELLRQLAEEEAAQALLDEEEYARQLAEEEAAQALLDEEEYAKQLAEEQEGKKKDDFLGIALESIEQHLSSLEMKGDQAAYAQAQAGVVAQIPGFSNLSAESRNYLTPGEWADGSSQYVVALVAVQLVLNYVYEKNPEERLGCQKLDQEYIVRTHFFEMYDKMLGAAQITTELNLHDSGVHDAIAKAITAIAELNRNFRETASISPVLRFEDALGSRGPGPSIADITQQRSPVAAASQGNENVSRFVSRVCRYVADLNSPLFQTQKKQRDLAGQREMLVDTVRQTPEVLALTQTDIEDIFRETNRSILDTAESLLVEKEIKAMASEAGIMQPGSPVLLQGNDVPRFKYIVDLVHAQQVGKEAEYLAQHQDDERKADFLDYFIKNKLHNELENTGLLEELMRAAQLTDDEQAAVVYFVSERSQKDPRIQYPPAFNVAVMGNKTVIEGMPALTSFLLNIGKDINGKNHFFAAGKINLLSQRAPREVFQEMRSVRDKRQGAAISKKEIQEMLKSLYAGNGITITILHSLTDSIYDLQFNNGNQSIHVNPDDVVSRSSSETEDSAVAGVIREHMAQELRGSSDLTDLIDKNERSLREEIARIDRAEIDPYIRGIANQLGFADSGQIGYLINHVSQL